MHTLKDRLKEDLRNSEFKKAFDKADIEMKKKYKKEYNKAVKELDKLIDVVKENENHPLAPRMLELADIVEKYSNEDWWVNYE